MSGMTPSGLSAAESVRGSGGPSSAGRAEEADLPSSGQQRPKKLSRARRNRPRTWATSSPRHTSGAYAAAGAGARQRQPAGIQRRPRRRALRRAAGHTTSRPPPAAPRPAAGTPGTAGSAPTSRPAAGHSAAMQSRTSARRSPASSISVAVARPNASKPGSGGPPRGPGWRPCPRAAGRGPARSGACAPSGGRTRRSRRGRRTGPRSCSFGGNSIFRVRRRRVKSGRPMAGPAPSDLRGPAGSGDTRPGSPTRPSRAARGRRVGGELAADQPAQLGGEPEHRRGIGARRVQGGRRASRVGSSWEMGESGIRSSASGKRCGRARIAGRVEERRRSPGPETVGEIGRLAGG